MCVGVPMIVGRSMHDGWLSNAYVVGDETGGVARVRRQRRADRAAARASSSASG